MITSSDIHSVRLQHPSEPPTPRRICFADARWRFGLLALLALAATACERDEKQDEACEGCSRVNVVNVAAGFGELEFRRDDALEATLGYGDSAAFVWDAGTYSFNLHRTLPGASVPLRLYSFSTELTHSNDYSVLLTNTDGWLRELIIEATATEVSGAEAEFTVAHANPTLEPVDVYVEPTGSTLAAANRRGTVQFRGTIPPVEVPAGEYEIALTAANDVADVRMVSNPFQLAGGVRTTLSILYGPPPRFSAAVLASAAGNDTNLVDRNLQPSFRAIQVMSSRDALDVTVNGFFFPALLPEVRFGTPSPYARLTPGDYRLSVSPAGNPGVFEFDQEFALPAGERGTWFITGDPGALTATYSSDNRFLNVDEASVTVYFGGTLIDSVDVFLAPADSNIDTLTPSATLNQTDRVTDLALALDTHVLTVRETATRTVVAGPVSAETVIEGVYTILLTNAVSGAGLDVTLLDDFTRF